MLSTERVVAHNFLTTSIKTYFLTVKDLLLEFEAGNIGIDLEVQRKLSNTRKKVIGQYVLDGLKGITYGAYFGPIVASERSNGVTVILDGQHRFYGLWHALTLIKDKLTVIEKIKNDQQLSNKDLKILNIGQDAMVEDLAVFLEEQEELREFEAIVEGTVIPLMAYVGLSKDQEQQLFHDINNLGTKVSKSLALSYNHNDKFASLTRWLYDYELVKSYIQPKSAGAKLKEPYVFQFSTVYKTVATLFGSKVPEGVKDEEIVQEVRDFFDIVIESLPDDVRTGQYLHKHAGVLPGIAAFVYKMKAIPKVCWKQTLKHVLATVPFSSHNMEFVRIGRALLQDEKVTFSGSNGAISAVLKTLDQKALRLDADGNEVFDAYGADHEQDNVITVSDEHAQRVGQEVGADVESEENEELKPAEPLNLPKCDESIINKLRESDEFTFIGTKAELGTAVNYPRTSVRDAVKRLETKGFIQVKTLENGSFEIKLSNSLIGDIAGDSN